MKNFVSIVVGFICFTSFALAHDQDGNLKTGLSEKYDSLKSKSVAQMTEDERNLYYALLRIEPATELANARFDNDQTQFDVYIDDMTYDVFVETQSELCKLGLEQVIGFNHMAPDEQEEWVLGCMEK